MDHDSSIMDLKNRVQQFCEERDWDQFHGAKDLGYRQIITESAELLEKFRFLSEEQSVLLLTAQAKRQEVEEELADIMFFVLRFAQRFHIDLDESLKKKIQKNSNRYPVDKAKGKNLEIHGVLICACTQGCRAVLFRMRFTIRSPKN